jgi:hypothetical protein
MWPIGALLASDASVPKLCAFVAVLWALVKAFIVFSWWSPLAVLAIGWLIALALVFTLRTHVQWLLVPGVFVTFILSILYVSEERPFGFLSNVG